MVCCTFTRKAADELKERLVALDQRAEEANVNTIHGICLGILREEGLDWDVLEAYEQKKMLGEVLKALDWDVGWRYPLRWIDLARARMFSPQQSFGFFHQELAELTGEQDAAPFADKLQQCFVMYEQQKALVKKIDFMDMLFRVMVLLEVSVTLERWQERVSHVLIDEHQDTDGLQFKILSLLAAPEDRLFAVADPDQSLYRWRSATPEINVYGFLEKYPHGQVLRMETNYRSTRTIVKIANCVLEGTPVATPSGYVPIEAIGIDDIVLAAQGRSTVGSFKVLATRRVDGWRNTVSVYIEGIEAPVQLTSEHRVFVTAKKLCGKTLDTDGLSWVYLMRKDESYRIGVTTSPSRRLSKEQGDALWLLQGYDSSSEAGLQEAILASRYGIPQVIFRSDARAKRMSQVHIDKLFATLDTGAAAQRLAFDFGFDLDEPLLVDDRKRVIGKICEIEPGYQGWRYPRHQIVLHTTSAQIRRTAEALGFRWNKTTPGNYRAQKYGDDWPSLRAMGQRLANVLGYAFQETGCWVKLPYRGTQPEHALTITAAGNLVPGLDVAVLHGDEIVLGRILRVDHKRVQCVAYDLEIDQVHNFIAGGMVVHNCAIERNYEDESRRAFHKTLVPRPNAPDGTQPIVHGFSSPEDEARWVGQCISELLSDGFRPGDVFVLYRTNAQSRPIEDEMIKQGIPYVIAGGDGFYSRAVVKDVLAYMSLVEKLDDNEAFRRVANIASAAHKTHYRGFGAAFFSECERANPSSLYQGMQVIRSWQPAFKQRGIDDLETLLDQIRVRGFGNPAQTILAIRELCYDSYLRRKEGITPDEEIDAEESGFGDLDELVEAATRFRSIQSMLGYVRMVQRMQRERQRGDGNAVVLSTVHKAKGLEKPVVFGVGIADGLLPHAKALGYRAPDELPFVNLSDLRDERCGMFVLVSRAKERLYLSWPETYRGRALEPSRFLAEIGVVSADEVPMHGAG
jgi:DNA helicase-2/ATP-dependent DNA helicase PcrA